MSCFPAGISKVQGSWEHVFPAMRIVAPAGTVRTESSAGLEAPRVNRNTAMAKTKAVASPAATHLQTGGVFAFPSPTGLNLFAIELPRQVGIEPDSARLPTKRGLAQFRGESLALAMARFRPRGRPLLRSSGERYIFDCTSRG